ncbi:S1C family serine protease [Deinococcus koreensis]|uniref:Peptidase S1 n=1 Tax=Deinococcus koreensis TaxID=2054903 RepID=A0A2K3V1P7_9DEIO|nr:trypsin-like peptidase domain-containing protein [Deinococcus koreensis]PNY82704.1 peptidase S1 [Deinococcus koreensis]
MTTLSDLSTALADAVQAASTSIVSVRSARPISGTVIGDGLILTVAHVLHADEVGVTTPDGRELKATVAGHDPSSDLALLRAEGLNLPALSAGSGGRIGELLLAVGRPEHGVRATLGFMERGPTERGPGRGWMPSGAAPFRGVSGGALLDARGGLVGILNAGVMRGDLVAVPAERAMKVAGLLAESGRVPRGYLGLSTQPVHFPEAGKAETEPTDSREARRGGRGWGGGWGGRRGGRGRLGLTVVLVEEGSPAAQAGVRVGDVLLALDGDPMRHPRELLDRIRDRAGEALTLRVLRGGEELDVPVTVGER